jgi:hypothetical protein
MSDADRKEAKNFREEQKYKTLNDYIYGWLEIVEE